MARPLAPALRGFTTPLTPTDYATLFDPLRGREIRGRITSVEQHGPFTTLTIEPGPGMVGTFQAGQFIGLGLQIDGRWRWRCYSLTNPPVRKPRGQPVHGVFHPHGRRRQEKPRDHKLRTHLPPEVERHV